MGASVIWIGTQQAVNDAISAADHLAEAPAYQKLRAALPADALVTAYLSGASLADALAQHQASSPAGSPSAETLLEAAFRLHPAQSAAEDALLKFPPLDGVGMTFEMDGSGLHLTAAVSVDAQYPAPTLTTATAGAGLLDLLPADSFAVFELLTHLAAGVPSGLASDHGANDWQRVQQRGGRPFQRHAAAHTHAFAHADA